MNKFKCTLKADRAGMKKGTVIEVTTSLASCDAVLYVKKLSPLGWLN